MSNIFIPITKHKIRYGFFRIDNQELFLNNKIIRKRACISRKDLIDMKEQWNDRALAIMEGGYDLHIHSAPDLVARDIDDYTLMKELDAMCMAGAVIKHHQESTAARATLANQYYGARSKLFGSITLNNGVGGLNPTAVEIAAKMGAKLVWMPTKDSLHEAIFFQKNAANSLYLLDDRKNLKSEVFDILDVIKANNLILATGHLSQDEVLELCKESRKRDIKTILTHPDYFGSRISDEIQIALASQGVFVEKMWLLVEGSIPAETNVSMNGMHQVSQEYTFRSIRKIGLEHIILSSDGGVKGLPSSTRIIHDFIVALINAGFTETEIRPMIYDNPAALLDI